MVVYVYFGLAMESFITKGFHVSFLVISGERNVRERERSKKSCRAICRVTFRRVFDSGRIEAGSLEAYIFRRHRTTYLSRRLPWDPVLVTRALRYITHMYIYEGVREHWVNGRYEEKCKSYCSLRISRIANTIIMLCNNFQNLWVFFEARHCIRLYITYTCFDNIYIF